MLALIHSEVSEALEADRKSKFANWDLYEKELLAKLSLGDAGAFNYAFETHVKNSFEDELADIIILVMDLAAFKGFDLEKHIQMKMRYNSLRPHKHGKKY